MSLTMVYSKLYILISNANDIKFISIARQMLDLLKDLYLLYCKSIFVEMQHFSKNIKMTLVFLAILVVLDHRYKDNRCFQVINPCISHKRSLWSNVSHLQ